MSFKYTSQYSVAALRKNHIGYNVSRSMSVKCDSNEQKYMRNRYKNRNQCNKYFDFLLFNQDSSRYNTNRNSISNIEKTRVLPKRIDRNSICEEKENINDNDFMKNKQNPENKQVLESSNLTSIFDNIMTRKPRAEQQKQQQQQRQTNSNTNYQDGISKLGLDGDCGKVMDQILDRKIDFVDCIENSYDTKHDYSFFLRRLSHIKPTTSYKNSRTTVEILQNKKHQNMMNIIEFSNIDDKDVINKYKQLEVEKYENVFQRFDDLETKINLFLGKEYYLGPSNVIRKLIESLNNFTFTFIQKNKEDIALTSDQLIILGKSKYDMSLSKFIMKYQGSTKVSRVYDFKNPSYYKLLDSSLINKMNFNFEIHDNRNKKSNVIIDKANTHDHDYVSLFNSMSSENPNLIMRFVLTHNLVSSTVSSSVKDDEFQQLQRFIASLKSSRKGKVDPLNKKINNIFNTIANENPDSFKIRTTHMMKNIRKYKILTYRKVVNSLKLKRTRYRRINVEVGNQNILFLKNVVILRQLKKHPVKQLPVSYTKIFNYLNGFNDKEVLEVLRKADGNSKLMSIIEELHSTNQIFPFNGKSYKLNKDEHGKTANSSFKDDINHNLKLRFKFYNSRRDYIYKYLKKYLNICLLNNNNFFFMMIGLIKMKYGDKIADKFIEFKILKGPDGILMLSDKKGLA